MEDIQLISLLKCVIECSEKAANIALECRSNKELFSLLVQEKPQNEKNVRFVQDFKTLADVLVQETVRWEVSQKFPTLHSNIFGEENNHFENTLGESVEVKVCDSPDDTTKLLIQVLDGQITAAKALAAKVYDSVEISLNLPDRLKDISLLADNIGIWIDPIDSTGEYIHGGDTGETVASSGLPCVCVLIGVYNLCTGQPILGVINQPFESYNSSNNTWRSHYYWGLCHENIKETSIIPKTNFSHKKIVISSCEDKKLLQLLSERYNTHNIAGAGYKCLLVAVGQMELYVLSCPTTFFWDTCGPHAILLSLGGGIVDFDAVLQHDITEDNLALYQLQYSAKDVADNKKPSCNSNGVVAYRDPKAVIELSDYLRRLGYHKI